MDKHIADSEGLADTSISASKTCGEESTATNPSEPTLVVNAPDPDEDNLDDLDDMLDEFSATKLDGPEKAPKTSSLSNATKEPPAVARIIEEEFAKQLQADMAILLEGLEKSPEMQAQFESMFGELESAGVLGEKTGQPSGSGGAQAHSAANNSVASAGGDESFQETIKRTIERMQASGEQATAAAVADDSSDIITELMKQMQDAGHDGEGNEEDFSKMLLGMMEQLVNKEILYEPMKELSDKFPEWINKNRATTKEEDMKRYEEQQKVVAEIVAKFEEKTYADSNVADREYIVDKMQKMQAAGSPPPDLVGDMASAQEAFGVPEEGCAQQ